MMKSVYLSLGVVVGALSWSWAQEVPVVPTSQAQLQLSFAPVVRKATPAVVNIYAARVVQTRIPPLFNDPIFRHFFGDTMPQAPGGGMSRIQSSLGSGVIVRADGIVLTNFHVIKNAAEIKVVLMDGREFSATPVVKDPRSDLVALRLKTDEKDLPFLELRDADELQVGDFVLAIGNPFGLGLTVTSGIVSGLARSQLGAHDFRSLIQTDAAVNPGNSGGPLVSLDGRIIGINTFIVSNTGGSIGIGFAIPSNLAALVLNAVDHGGVIKRPWSGLEVTSITQKMAQELDLKKPAGVLVKRVYDETPAQKAGLKAQDVILKVNGRDIPNESSFRFRIVTASISNPTRFTVLRKGQIQDIDVVLEAPDLSAQQEIELSGRHPLIGAKVVGLSPSLADDLGLGYQEGGVAILLIRPGTAASLSGFTAGDIITEVNGEKVKTADDLQQALNRHKSGGWSIQFRRGQEVGSILVERW